MSRRESGIGVGDGATRTRRPERSNRVRRVRPPRYQENINADEWQTKGVLSFLERGKKTRGGGGARKKEPRLPARKRTHRRRRGTSRCESKTRQLCRSIPKEEPRRTPRLEATSCCWGRRMPPRPGMCGPGEIPR